MSVVTIGGDLVHYEVLGRGLPIILVHGWIGSWRYWVPLMQQLDSTRYRVYAVDLYGFGDSSKNPEKYMIDQQVNLILQFMVKLGMPKAAMIGHGLGALVLTQFAKVHPERIARMFLANAPLFDPGNLDSRVPAGHRVLLTPPTPETIAKELSTAEPTTPAKPNPEPTIPSRQEQAFHELPTIATNDPRAELLAKLDEIESKENSSAKISSPIPQVAPVNGQNRLQKAWQGMKLNDLLSKCFKTSEPSYDKLKVDVEKTDDKVLSYSIQHYDAGAVLDILRLFESPVVIVHGDDDPIIPRPKEAVWNYLTVDKEDTIVPIPLSKVRHFPMLEQETFPRLIDKFLTTKDISKLEVPERWHRKHR